MMLALITAFLVDLPIIGSAITKLTQLFTKTQAQKQADTTQEQQTEAQQMAGNGRPKWD